MIIMMMIWMIMIVIIYVLDIHHCLLLQFILFHSFNTCSLNYMFIPIYVYNRIFLSYRAVTDELNKMRMKEKYMNNQFNTLGKLRSDRLDLIVIYSVYFSYLSINLPFYLSMSDIFIYISHLSILSHIYLSLYNIHPSIYLHLSIYLSIYLCIY